jgi:uncharacterized protein (DUF4415 family)
MKKLVHKTLADSPMTSTRKRKLAELAQRPDSEIDFSEIPPLKESFWENAVRNPFYRPVKKQMTVRLDADVVAWLRQPGKGYQTRLNRVLREVMLGEIRKSAGPYSKMPAGITGSARRFSSNTRKQSVKTL